MDRIDPAALDAEIAARLPADADPAEVQDLRNVLAREQIVFAVIARNTRRYGAGTPYSGCR